MYDPTVNPLGQCSNIINNEKQDLPYRFAEPLFCELHARYGHKFTLRSSGRANESFSLVRKNFYTIPYTVPAVRSRRRCVYIVRNTCTVVSPTCFRNKPCKELGNNFVRIPSCDGGIRVNFYGRPPETEA